MKTALTGANVFDGHRVIENAALIYEENSIIGVVPRDEVPADCTITELNGGLLSPGFIDLQINGAGGVLFNNAPDIESLKTMAAAVRPLGVTRILPTIITDDITVTRAAVDACTEASKTVPGILGIHVEGPFFCLKKNGVHQKDKIRKVGNEDWDWIKKLSDIPSILTLAPDQVSPSDIQKISDLNIRICAGHTNATYDQVVSAHNAGLSGFTHLFNAMRQFSGREPGVVGAALTLKNTWAGMIADGIHVHNASMLHAIASKGYEQVFLVSDAMATIGSDQKTFELYGERIEEKDGQLVNAEGKLAGSAISLADAVRYCAHTLQLPVEQVLAMATRVPASYLNINSQYGTFASGAVADICHLDDELNVLSVWQDGLKH